MSPTDNTTARRWRHVKRGTIYTEVCRAELQAATSNPAEGHSLVIYRGEDGKMWARAAGEFTDGRFVEVMTDLPTPHGPHQDRNATLHAAIWAAMMEIENGYPATAYETLQHAWEYHRG